MVTLGVGLHKGYGPAQRLYVKRGYIPDGSGLWFNNEPLAPYAPCENSDDLVLYFSKKRKLKKIPKQVSLGIKKLVASRVSCGAFNVEFFLEVPASY